MTLGVLVALLIAAVAASRDYATFDPETSFWVYSSVAQTFAALLGLTLVVVTFRRQYLDSELQRIEAGMFDYLGATAGWKFLEWDDDLERHVETEFTTIYTQKLMGEFAPYAGFVGNGGVSDEDLQYIEQQVDIPNRLVAEFEGNFEELFAAVARRKKISDEEAEVQMSKLRRTMRTRDRLLEQRGNLLGNWIAPMTLMSGLLVLATASLPWSASYLAASTRLNAFLVTFTILGSALSATYLIVSLLETLRPHENLPKQSMQQAESPKTSAAR